VTTRISVIGTVGHLTLTPLNVSRAPVAQHSWIMIVQLGNIVFLSPLVLEVNKMSRTTGVVDYLILTLLIVMRA